jgi:hypothetical protein
MDYIPKPVESLPTQKQHGYHKVRKHDAALRSSAAAQSNILNILVNVEFTKTEAPTVASNPLIGARVQVYQDTSSPSPTPSTCLPSNQHSSLYRHCLSTAKTRRQRSLSPFSTKNASSLRSFPTASTRRAPPLSQLSYTSSELRHYTSSATTLSLSTTSLRLALTSLSATPCPLPSFFPALQE